MQRVDEAQLDWLGQAQAPTEQVLKAWQPALWPVAPDWKGVVDRFLSSPAGAQLAEFIKMRLTAGARILPPHPFYALELTPRSQVRVVILGQDPYHGLGQAQGLAFSVAPGVKLPPSLRNIFQEVARDPGLSLSARARIQARSPQPNGSLVPWARQGVLLLNTSLTVEESMPASHAKQGWEVLTDEIVKSASELDQPVVFMLWGVHAQTKRPLIEQCGSKSRHLILAANHPSPLSAARGPAPFLGCLHFARANAFLRGHGQTMIDWS
ncbi:uracil-DNA glycosylase [Rhodoferax sp.]|uniref:uracil-DNA glycosylase n=1 Tax=Rhodoferax sp. TaxID=50421 RepID=UPI00274859C2|nr:uracil-DNA glycosylase [Rhodoferax sp.]